MPEPIPFPSAVHATVMKTAHDVLSKLDPAVSKDMTCDALLWVICLTRANQAGNHCASEADRYVVMERFQEAHETLARILSFGSAHG